MSDLIYIIISVILLIAAAILTGYQANKIKSLEHKISLLEQEKQIKGY